MHNVFAFAPPRMLRSFVSSATPPSHRQAARFHFLNPRVASNTSICILNMSRKWLPSRLLPLCLADERRTPVNVTQTKRGRRREWKSRGAGINPSTSPRVIYVFCRDNLGGTQFEHAASQHVCKRVMYQFIIADKAARGQT